MSYNNVSALSFMLLTFLSAAGCRRAPGVPHRDISTTQGRVRGYLVDNDYYAYLGIPYAHPVRFKAPKPPRNWDSIFEATHRIRCPQIDGPWDENCLVINVFTPIQAASLSVLVYIHGDDFQKGWGPTEPIKLLRNRNIIFVTFNYRLGPLGFLCLNVPEAPGNVGLKDQVAALYWIHRNILHFGGNPSDITVYGTESGAVSIELIVLFRAGEGLFQKAILEGGSILSPASISYDHINIAFNTAKTLGYIGDENKKELANFFSKLTLKQLINVTREFLPCIESESYNSHSLVDSDPYSILENSNFQSLPVMILYSDKKYSKEIDVANTILERFENLLPSNLVFKSIDVKKKVAEIVKNFYFGENDLRKAFENYMNDVLVHYPIVKMAVMFAIKSKQPVFLMKTQTAGPTACTTKNEYNCNLADLLSLDMNENIGIQKAILTTLVTNFITLGDPTPIITEETPIIWQPITYPNVEPDTRIIPQLIFDQRMKLGNAATQNIMFWDHVYKKFYKETLEEKTSTTDDELVL